MTEATVQQPSQKPRRVSFFCGEPKSPNGERFHLTIEKVSWPDVVEWDVLVLVRNQRTGERTHRLFLHEPDERHVGRAFDYALDLLSLDLPAELAE